MQACCGVNEKEKSQSNSLKPLGDNELETVLQITGADCSDEINAITKEFAAIGVQSVSVSLVASTVTVRHSSSITVGDITKTIEKTGVKVVSQAPSSFFAVNRVRILMTSFAGIFLASGFLISWISSQNSTLGNVLYTAAALLAGTLVFPKALRALKQKSLDMNVLMTVAVIGAFAIKEFSEGATVVFLFSLAELLEAFSVDRARKAIREVLKLTPQVAWKKLENTVVSVPVLEVSVDDILIVRPGESVPLDGQVIEGSSSVNQAAVTGESKLVAKGAGDQVFAGTVNENGSLTFKVTKVFQDTKISRVMKLIEEAQDQKAPSQRFVDQFARIYTPVVFVLAVLVALIPPVILGQDFNLWFYRALVLLVIACPCALVIATPISVVSGLASLARKGVLVKGGVYLEALGKLRAIAVDKTGTLTEGKFRVQDLCLFSEMSDENVIKIAGALESLSTHPLAKAILDYASEKNVTVQISEDFTAVPGRGAEGTINGQTYFAGNHRFAHELGVCTPKLEKYLDTLEENALSLVIIGRKPSGAGPGTVLGVFSMGDQVKPNARAAMTALHAAGIEKILVLSGDNQKTVDAIGRQTGIDEAIGDLLPEDKVAHIKELKSKFVTVGMIGDGINDAPALAHASIGIAMGAAGTDAAIETADIALMQDDLEQLPKAILHGRRVLSIIRFNIGFALMTKVVFLGLAVVGISNLWLAVAADMGASILVTLNALRLLKMRSADE